VFGVSFVGGQDGLCVVLLHRRSIDVDLHEVARYDDDNLKGGWGRRGKGEDFVYSRERIEEVLTSERNRDQIL
jgi:hypothetical protein